eukprot:m.274714 g.274714  ORF g.274714 m.274714 type:complete len:74 (-) comp16290_c0_seq35:1817-2038(-)
MGKKGSKKKGKGKGKSKKSGKGGKSGDSDGLDALRAQSELVALRSKIAQHNDRVRRASQKPALRVSCRMSLEI